MKELLAIVIDEITPVILSTNGIEDSSPSIISGNIANGYVQVHYSTKCVLQCAVDIVTGVKVAGPEANKSLLEKVAAQLYY